MDALITCLADVPIDALVDALINMVVEAGTNWSGRSSIIVVPAYAYINELVVAMMNAPVTWLEEALVDATIVALVEARTDGLVDCGAAGVCVYASPPWARAHVLK